MKIIDNCISKELQNKIEKYFVNKTFPWFYQENSLPLNTPKRYKKENNNTFNAPQFTHLFIDQGKINSSHMTIIIELLKELKMEHTQILRCKANLKFKTSTKKKHNIFHVDLPYKQRVMIYYVNDSDGDTYLQIGPSFKKVQPKKGRLLCFDGKIMHAANHPRKKDKRLIINFDMV